MSPRAELEAAIVGGDVQRVRELLLHTGALCKGLDVNRNAKDSTCVQAHTLQQ